MEQVKESVAPALTTAAELITLNAENLPITFYISISLYVSLTQSNWKVS